MYNLLTEPLIRYKTDSGQLQTSTLPQVYTALAGDKVTSFPALRPHQRHAWHAFLVQLGAMALHRAGEDGSDLPTDADEWAALIRGLTSDWLEDEPWQLVVDDIAKPAFMQPPARDWSHYDRKELVLSPDDLDMLDTAKNHDLKTLVAMDAAVEDWCLSLITMQTMNGQVGRGNYPIARMNSGDGSRTAFSVTPTLRLGGHIQRDIEALLVSSSEIMDDLPYRWDGLALLWTREWNGEKERLPITDLHPFFIEVCRRRRLSIDDNSCIHALKAPSEGRLVAASNNRGVMGDPWALVNLIDKNGPKALTLQRESFSYKEVTKYLVSADWKRPLLSRPIPGERNVCLTMYGIRRKKGGQTEGYYERVIPVRSERLRTAMLRNVGRAGPDDLGVIAQSRVEQSGIVQRALRDATATFLAQGKNIFRDLTVQERQRIRINATGWSNRFDRIVDESFFEHLQDELEENSEENRLQKRREWARRIVSEAEGLLDQATASLPCRYVVRYRAKAASKRAFWGLLKSPNGIPDLLRPAGES